MKGKKWFLCNLCIGMILMLGGCGGKMSSEQAIVVVHNDPILVSLEGKEFDLFVEDFSVDSELISTNQTSISMMRRNADMVVYGENYWIDGAMNPWKYQIWSMDMQSKEKKLL